MPAILPNPLTELRGFLATTAERFRSLRLFGPLVRVQVAEDIVEDVVAREARMAREAYAAEQNDLEALKAIAAAERPDSDGGRAITPKEAAKIIRLIRRSAEKSHTISDLAAP